MARNVGNRHGRRPRRRRLWRGWITGALLAACVDGPTSPGRFGELRIRPVYQEGDAPALLSVTVDSANVRATRIDEPGTAVVDTMVRYDADTLSLGWVLDLRDAREELRVEVEIYDGGALVYTGVADVVVQEADIAAAGAEAVPVAYVGPPVVATVSVTPASATLDALGATATFAAEARDRHGVVVATAFTWSSGDAAVATADAATGVVTAVANGTTAVTASAGAASGSGTVVVAQRVAAVVVTPDNPALTALGATVQLVASVRDANGHPVANASVAWTSSDPDVATVDAGGSVTAVTGGAATITATSAGVSGSTLVTVSPVTNVASIVVTPANALRTARGATAQFTAQARDAGGNVLEGVPFVWSSSAAEVATVDAATGLATVTGHGTTVVSASANGISASATLEANLTASVASVVVSPAGVTLQAIGATQQYLAQALDANGVAVPGVSFTWGSAAPGVATMNAVSGLATATGNGATTITASVGNVQGTATLSVNLIATVASVVVSPPSATLDAINATQHYTAQARDANGDPVPGVSFTWSSDAPGVAAIGATSGVATAVGNGTTTIIASVGEVQGTATLHVDLIATVASIVVSPPTATLNTAGSTQQFTAQALDANGAVVPGVAFGWQSTAEAVATIDATSGLATAASHGSTTITASVGEVQASATLTVNLANTVASIVVSPANATLTAKGATQPFTAQAFDASGAPLPGVPLTWSSATPEVATMGATTGLATAVAHGTTTITASVGEVHGTATLNVDLIATVASVVVSPASARLEAIGATQQFTAQAFDANGVLVPGVTAAWVSSAPTVGTIDAATGVAVSAGHGSATITASVGDVQGIATLTVNLTTTVASVVVSPASATLAAIGATQQLTAQAFDANGTPVPGMTFGWSSVTPGVATIGATSGVATAAGNGTTTITASVGDVQGTAILTVQQQVARIAVTPGSAELTVGEFLQLSAVAYDANDHVVAGVAFAWESSDPTVARVNASGVTDAKAAGTVTIRATAAGISGTASLTVSSP